MIRKFMTPRMRRWSRRAMLLAISCVAIATIAAASLLVLSKTHPFPIERLDHWPGSPLVTDRTGQVLLCVTGEDGQWRFPVAIEEMPPWLVRATIAIEDERFMSHPGVDPIAAVRAAWQNVCAGRVVSGASTLTMQVCRMMDERPRTWSAKSVECFRALQLEQVCGKREILETYLNIAPYGGNIRGVEAASRLYFSKKAADLSLAEAALLAGLPQSPSRYRPDRFPARAKARRDYVLRRMADEGMVTDQQCRSALQEPVMLSPFVRSTTAQHAAWLAVQRYPSGGRTTIDMDIQSRVEDLAAEYAQALPRRTQIAVVVVDIASADVVALVGSADFDNGIDGQNNGVLRRRSPGSALKPFVYAAAFEAGRLNPDSTVYDIPIQRGGWSPRNFDHTFAGEIKASDALRRSLNIPAILVAEEVGLARCIGLIEAVGIRLPDDAQTHAGLGVVVGAAEVTLMDLVNGYATLGRGGIRKAPRLLMSETSEAVRVLDGNVCAAVDDILSSRRRTPHGLEKVAPRDIPWFMWKTGTSSGRRDAWAIGHNRRFAIGVWVGRFSGAGNSKFVGVEVAEPLLAALFSTPQLRTDINPAAPKPWVVRRPLAPPREASGSLMVTSPLDHAVLIAVSRVATIHPQAEHAGEVSWFLNGAYVGNRELSRLDVEPGAYELRCVEPRGASSAVRFTVRAADAP